MASLAEETSDLTPRDLFGGAMTINVPSSWIDTEAFMDIIKRPVPDNQEIFMAPRSDANGAADERPEAAPPVALFIDILELASDVEDPEQVPHFHALEVLKRDERAAEAEALAVVPGAPLDLAESLTKDGGAGLMGIAATFDACDMEVAVVRIPKCETDLIFSLHGRIAAGEQAAGPPLTELVPTLQVLEWGLFGGGGDEGQPQFLGA
jgi:hypothetical protein